ncbi:hypothetical protein T10_4797 [Trichinella papuae]|uniref:Uncharacterized protein n=1 Tax=Trichinella papuae TaxID=268474 RepID=A0A0V1MLT7_9BILA|nr:hypothetical protein T10_4797 [Trichinella papuae]
MKQNRKKHISSADVLFDLPTLFDLGRLQKQSGIEALRPCCKKNKQKGRSTFVPLFRCWRCAVYMLAEPAEIAMSV